MKCTLVDCESVFEDEPSDKTAMLITTQNAHFLQDINLADHLNIYGAIQTIRYERFNGYHYAIVQFKDAVSATNLVRNASIVLCGVDFIVNPFHSIAELIQSIENKSVAYRPFSAALENPDENILNILNDDCLTEVFRRLYSLFDVNSVANVCTRFKQVAKKTFIPLLKQKQIDFTELKADRNVELVDVEKFLRCFGSSVVSVLLYEEHFQNIVDVVNPILKLMQKHCPNLRSLTLHKNTSYNELESETLIETRALLSKLSRVEITLTFKRGTYGNPVLINKYAEFISACTGVETLIVPVTHLNLPEIHFPNLKAFETDAVYTKLDGFLMQNRQIEKLSIPTNSTVLQLVCENMPGIRELSFQHGLDKIRENDSAQLKNLKKAKISIMWNGMRENTRVLFEIENVTSLQVLLHNQCNLSILIELTKRLGNLDNVELYNSFGIVPTFTTELIKTMLHHARKLTQLKIKWQENYTYHLQEIDYDELLQEVVNRCSHLKLCIVLDSVTKRCDGEHGIKSIFLNADSPWLTIIKRYVYLTRKASSPYEKFERRDGKTSEVVIHNRTHVDMSTLASFGTIPNRQHRIRFNVV